MSCYIQRIASGGYSGFRFFTLPLLPLQCVERFHLLKFAGYIHNHKILSGNIFGLILKNKMASTAVFSTFSKEFCWPSRAKVIIGRDLKFAGYVHHYKILSGNIFGLILKNKMASTAVFSTFSKEFCWPSRAKVIIGRDLKFAGYVHHYKILTGNIFGLI